MLFFHASSFHSDVAWLQAREEMATRQSLLGCCSHHEKARDLKSLWEKNPRNAVVQSPKRGWEGKGRAVLSYPGRGVLSYPWAERGDFPSPAWVCRKQKPPPWCRYICHQRGPLHPSPWGDRSENVLRPSSPSRTRPGVTPVSWKRRRNFTQMSKWENSFLHFPTLHSTLISTFKSFIDPWQLNGKLSCCSTERRDRFSNSCLISLSTWKWNSFKDLGKASEHLVPSNNEFQFPLAETGIILSLFYQLSK